MSGAQKTGVVRRPAAGWAARAKGVARWYGARVHGDERGAIAVLTLLMIWGLVGMLGMVWNTTEQAVQKQRVQAAADAAAHMAATLMGRTVNDVAAQSMVISQDASMETIWLAISPTRTAVLNRLNGELAAAEQAKQTNRLRQINNQARQILVRIAVEQQLTQDALAPLTAGTGANYTTLQERTQTAKRVRQATFALNFVNTQTVPALTNYITSLPNATVNDAILDVVIAFIKGTELPYLNGFTAQTAAVAREPVDIEMANHEAMIYRQTVNDAAQLPARVEAERAKIAGYTKTEITLATLREDGGGTQEVKAPLKPAGSVASVTKTDTIREAYATLMPFMMSTTVVVDPISPNTWEIDPLLPAPVEHSKDQRIWYPDLPVAVDPGIRALYPQLPARFGMQGTPSATIGWGESWVAPLERYFHGRVDGDSRELDRSYWEPLDESRGVTLRDTIRNMMGGWATVQNVPTPPTTIPDGQVNEVGVIETVPVLPRLTATAGADAGYRTQVDLYNRHSAAYMGEVWSLVRTLQSAASIYDRFTQRFARDVWYRQVDAARRHVAWNLGRNKQMMVLSTYELYPIPEWAKGGIFQSVSSTVEDEMTSLNMERFTTLLINSGVPAAEAARVADQIVRPAAAVAGRWIAGEFVDRPWPYEIKPSDIPVPPTRGISRADRQKYFTVMAGARQAGGTTPRLLLPNVFGRDSTQLVAYAQAETFNWMEYNDAYGGAERFDELMRTPWAGYGTRYGLFTASPRLWRVGSVGGWNWRARLSLADALPEMLEKNGELAGYMNSAGVVSFDADWIKTVNLH